MSPSRKLVARTTQRLEGVEDALDRIDERVGTMGGGAAGGVGALEQRLAAIEGQLTRSPASSPRSRRSLPRSRRRRSAGP